MIEPTFGAIVKERRTQMGLTQTELARRVACAPVTVRKIEYDALRPSVQIAERMAAALQIPEEDQLAFIRLARAEREPTPIPTPPPTPEEVGGHDLSGRAIKGYQLGERIGTGGYGAVYRGVQSTVDRDVAIKIILPKFADRPEFIRRFEAEARLVARLEHPHIVPLYDYWREPGIACLIMRYLRGGSLESMLKHGPLTADILLPVLEQICAALHSAHRAGVIHRDIKPANVLLDEDGNAYLADFGVAKNLGNHDVGMTQGDVVIGSPAYISPEQILSEPVKPQTDIYSLGVMLYELLTGKKPFKGPTPVAYIRQHLNQDLPLLGKHNGGNGNSVPSPLDIVIGRATAKDPRERYSDVSNFLADIRRAMNPNSTTADLLEDRNGVITPPHVAAMLSLPDMENPYKGLRAFGEADAADFFGRDTLIQALLTRMADEDDLSRFLAVVGPSGSGKSSAVRAGLLPALRRGGIPCSECWFITEMVPGAHPFEELEAALLRVAINPPASLLTQLRTNDRGLLRSVNRILHADDETELVLVIDQFEEIFTLVEYEEIRAGFLNSLLTAVLDPRSRVRVVITLRADFTDRPLQYVDFGELVRQRTEFVLPLTPDELEQAITGPTKRAGLALEPGLLRTIIGDIGDQPGTLPLLQYALTELFERRDGRKLTISAYKQSGGVLGALARRADDVYTHLNPTAQEATRQFFLRLVTLGEGVEDTRRRVLQSELRHLSFLFHPSSPGDKQMTDDERQMTIDGVIAAFGKYRLLTFDHDPVTRSPTVEVAHEALLREWVQLRSWLDENRSDIRTQRLLAIAVTEWLNANRDPGFLLRGSRLDQFEAWAAQTSIALTEKERAFLAASTAAREERQSKEAARQIRELDMERAAVQRLRIIVGVLLIASVMGVILTLAVFKQNRATIAESNIRATAQADAELQHQVAVVQKNNAQREANRRAKAEADALASRDDALKQASIGLASQALLELNGSFPERSVLLALEALDNYPYTWQAERALGQAVLGNKLRLILRHDAMVNTSEWSADERRILTSSDDKTAVVWDAKTGEKLLTLTGSEEFVQFAHWSPDETRIVTGGGEKVARVWDAKTGEILLTLKGHDDKVWDGQWTSDGSRILTAGFDGTAKVWDATTGEELLSLEGHTDRVWDALWPPDETRIVTRSDDGTAKVWDAETGEERLSLAHESPVMAAQWSPDGGKVATASFDGTAKIWDAETGEEILTLTGHKSDIYTIAWSPDGNRIATGSLDLTAKEWDANTGEEFMTFRGHNDFVQKVAWSPDNKYILTASADGTAKIWDAKTGIEVNALFGHTATVRGIKWSADGKIILTDSLDGTAKMWKWQDTLQSFNGPENGPSILAWSPDSTRIGRGFPGHLVKIWDANTGDVVTKFTDDEAVGFLGVVRWSPDGDRLLTTSFAKIAKVWDAHTATELFKLESHDDGTYDGEWSPDGTRIVTASADGTAKVWDGKTGAEVTTFTGHSGQVFIATFSPDSKYVVSTSEDKSARIWNATTGEEVRNLYPDDFGFAVFGAAWSPDGTRIATYAQDGIGRIWDATTGKQLQTITGAKGDVWDIYWSPDSKRLVAGGRDGVSRVWDAATGAEIMDYSGGYFVTPLWSPDGTRLGTSSWNGTLKIYPAWQTLEELKTYARECCVIRQLTLEERTQFGLPPVADGQ